MRNRLQHVSAVLALLAAWWLAAWPVHGAVVNLELASGQLGAGAVGLFNFSLGGAIGAGESLRIDTQGSSFDTEIALYDSQGRMLATHDDINAHNHASQLLFGAGQGLQAGDYTLVLGSFNTIFRNNDIVAGSGTGGNFQLNLQTTQPVVMPASPTYLAQDGHLLPASIQESVLGQGWLEAHGVQRFDFFLQDDVSGGDWLALYTAHTDFDTELGLYDAQGRLVATNDDIDSDDALSRLSFGLDGDNGRSLLSGAYTLLLGGFNTIYRDDWQATSSMSHGGQYAVYVQSSNPLGDPTLGAPGGSFSVPEASTGHLMLLGLLLLARRRIK